MSGRVMSLIVAMVVAAAGAAAAQTVQQSVASAAAVYEDWIEVMAEITGGVEVGERDLRNFLDHWRDLEELELGDLEDEDPAQFKQNLQKALADPRYRSWAAARGLDPDDYVRRSMRITSLVMLQQAEAQEAMAERQHAEHAAMVEEQCPKVDAATCQQMREGVKASLTMAEAMRQARQKLRPATAGEQVLLERYAGEIEAVMADDEGDDYEDDEDYGDYEDYEDYEDYDDYEDDDG